MSSFHGVLTKFWTSLHLRYRCLSTIATFEIKKAGKKRYDWIRG